MPKNTITNVPNDMTDESLVTKICDKDSFLNSEINIDVTFPVIKSLTSKKVYWSPKLPERNDKMFSTDQETYHER